MVRERIIEPLQLKNTYPYLYKNIPNLATPYHNGKDVTAFLDYRYFANIANAAGSIASTLNDMEKFYTAFFETDILLKKETVQLMMHSGSKYYGLGLMKTTENGITLYGHGGNNIGYSFRNGYNPATKNLYLLYANSRTVPFNNAVSTDILNYLHDKKVAKIKTVDIAKFKKHLGKYLLKEANMVFEILEENNKLYLYVKAQEVKSLLLIKSENKLVDTTVGATITLIKDTTDAVTFSQNGFTTTMKRIKS